MTTLDTRSQARVDQAVRAWRSLANAEAEVERARNELDSSLAELATIHEREQFYRRTMMAEDIASTQDTAR